MRKMRMLLLLICVVALLPLQALAATEITLEPEQPTAAPGTEVTVTVSVSGVEGMGSLGAMVEYDEKSLELVDGEWLIEGILSEVSTGEKVAVIMLKDPESVDGPVLTFRFKVLETAAVGVQEIHCSVVCLDETGDRKELGTPKATITVTEAVQTAPEETQSPETVPSTEPLPPEKQETDEKLPARTEPASVPDGTQPKQPDKEPESPGVGVWATVGAVTAIFAVAIGIFFLKKRES